MHLDHLPFLTVHSFGHAEFATACPQGRRAGVQCSGFFAEVHEVERHSPPNCVSPSVQTHRA